MKKSYFRLSGVLLFLLCIAMLTACQNSDENKKVSKDIFAMDTYMTVTAYGKNAENGVNKAVDEINRLETKNKKVIYINLMKQGAVHYLQTQKTLFLGHLR